MRNLVIPFVVMLAAGPAAAQSTAFSVADFQRLSFLEGHWQGVGPDGAPFYDLYDRPDATTLRSRRFTDNRFTTVVTESRITLENGQIVSRWGEYSWKAVRVTNDLVEFEPVAAPNHFSWRRAGEYEVEVVQRWTDAQGAPQSYTVTLERMIPVREAQTNR